MAKIGWKKYEILLILQSFILIFTFLVCLHDALIKVFGCDEQLKKWRHFVCSSACPSVTLFFLSFQNEAMEL
jgi:hypothetical protein